jgi:hypothetical protein
MRTGSEDPAYGTSASGRLDALSRELRRYEVPEEVEARNLASEAAQRGVLCGCCGRKLAGRETAYFGAEVYVGMWPLGRNRHGEPQVCQLRYDRTVLCERCAPEWLSPERDDVVT